MTAQTSAKPLSYSCAAPHLIAHPVHNPMYLLGSDVMRQILLFAATPKPPSLSLGHSISHMTIYCLSPEKLNKKQNKTKRKKKHLRDNGTERLSQTSHPQSSRLSGPHLQSVFSSQQGQISPLKVGVAPAWQTVPSHRGLGLPWAQPQTQLCSGSVCSSGMEAAAGSAEPSLVPALLPGSLP